MVTLVCPYVRYKRYRLGFVKKSIIEPVGGRLTEQHGLAAASAHVAHAYFQAVDVQDEPNVVSGVVSPELERDVVLLDRIDGHGELHVSAIDVVVRSPRQKPPPGQSQRTGDRVAGAGRGRIGRVWRRCGIVRPDRIESGRQPMGGFRGSSA